MTIVKEDFSGTALAHLPDATQDNLVTYLNDVDAVSDSETASETAETNAETAQAAAEAAQAAAEAAQAAAEAVDDDWHSGSITIAIGQANGTATVPAGLTAKPVFAMIRQAAADATLTQILRAAISGTTLTVYGDANATAAVTVSYFIDGR